MTDPITSMHPTSPIHSGAERRQTGRAGTDIPALLRFPDRLQVIQGNLCDLSVGGTGFIGQQVVAPHTKCTLQFTLPVLPQLPAQQVNLPATVVHSMQVIGQARQYRINLQFTQLPQPARQHIEALIRHALRQG